MSAYEFFRSISTLFRVPSFFHVGIAGIGGLMGYLIGDFDGFFKALLAFMVLDYVTGVMRAVLAKKSISSIVGFVGICKKVLIICMVCVGNIADQTIIGTGEVVRDLVIFFYLANEGISLLENATAIGLPVPDKLREILTQLHGGGKKSSNSQKGSEESK